jgi:hypothetical protein
MVLGLTAFRLTSMNFGTGSFFWGLNLGALLPKAYLGVEWPEDMRLIVLFFAATNDGPFL